MFNLAKRVRERQLKKAILIQNAIMLGIFGYQRKTLGAGSAASTKLDDIIASAINQLFGKEGETLAFSQDDMRAYSEVIRSVKSDPLLDKLILRVLFDIFTLGTTLKNTGLLAEYPTIAEVLERGKEEHPNVFEDCKETQFKMLAERFADKYDPGVKGSLLKLFSK